jgi:hypothetical protein
VQKLAQGLGLFGIEGPVNGVRTFGALPKRPREPLLVESVEMALRAVWGLQPKERAIW